MAAVAYRNAAAMRKVAVVGAGLIGTGWVAAYLAGGFEVSVYDPSPATPDKVRAHIRETWPALQALGLANGSDPEAVSFHDDLAQALDGADFVHENTHERQDLKAALYKELGALAPPDVLIASSTSGMPVTLLQADCPHPERCVLGHPFNPVHLMPLVEIGGGQATDPAAIDVAEDLYLSMGKRPVRLQREIVGHIANRLTSAMFREAVSLVADGYASVKDVDDAIRYGPALKWAIQGQFTTFHTSGGDGGLGNFLKHFAPGIVQRWQTMTVPDLTDPQLQARLTAQVDDANAKKPVKDIARHQDDFLVKLIAILMEDNSHG